MDNNKNMEKYTWTDPATGQSTAQGVGAPTLNPLYIGETNWKTLQGQYTPYQLQQATKNVGGNIFWNPNVNITDIPAQMPASTLGTGSTIDNMPPPQQPTGIEGLMAGVKPGMEGVEAQLKSLQELLASQPKKDEYTKRLDEFTEANKTAGRDLQEEMWSRFQMQPNVEQLQKLLPQMAALQANFDKLAQQNLDRPISSRIIGGTQDRLQRQQAVEMAGLGAMAQAYQGNIDMARTLSQDAINAKYADQEMYINNLRQQISFIEQDLNREEKVKMTQLELVINERERAIAEAKELEANLSNLMISAAQNGAGQETLDRIMKSKTYQEAIMAGREFLNISTTSSIPQKIGQDANGNDLFYNPLTKTVQTAKQLSANQLGAQVGTIMGLPAYATRAANPGVNRSDRNNNPGNIKVSSYTKEFDGVAGVESDPAADGGNFLIFESPEAGLNAMGRLLLEGRSYQNVNAETAIKKYNGNGSYGALDVGLDPNKDFQSQIKDPNKRLEVTRAMAIKEGWSGATSSITDVGEFDMKEYEGIRQKVFNNQGVADAAKTVVRDFEEALKLMDIPLFQNQSIMSASQRALLKNVPGSVVFEIDRLIESAKSNIGIDKLLEIKASGAGLGQVPQRQLVTLQSVLGLMDVTRDPQLLKRDMQQAIDKYNDIIERTNNENSTLGKQHPQYIEALNLDMSGQGMSVAPSGTTFSVVGGGNVLPSGLTFEIINE